LDDIPARMPEWCYKDTGIRDQLFS